MIKKVTDLWNSKNRTALRSIKPGDIFAFTIQDGRFGLGRIMAKNDLGHVAEFFDVVLVDEAELNNINIESVRRLREPIILDSYSLFDRKVEGDWRIILHQKDYFPSSVDGLFYKYGSIGDRKRVDVFGANEIRITEEEAKSYPNYSPMGDAAVKSALYGPE